MFILETTFTNLETNKEETIQIKTSSFLKMKPQIEKLNMDHWISSWDLTKTLPKMDRWGSKIEWNAGNSGINAGAYLSECIDDEFFNQNHIIEL